MRVFGPLATVLLSVLVLSGTPALSGCDSSATEGVCTDDVPFSFEDISPEETELGDTVATNACVSLRYVGRLADGSGTFDEGTLNFIFTSQPSNTFYTAGSLIPGFVLGMAAQQVGETRRVIIPPSLGYGSGEIEGRDGGVGIPSCATLEFEITITAINGDTRICRRPGA
ncbi:FKBP-type peptidyl-prolyl cis-trans isomerase [Rubrivirga sp.]|uniref:FKBP-type peptidyl-prolyl cis-trans isomerase n=1 Tax=Rubrivirga sp. TaxID=1885344 RepID=UPI003C76EBA0